MSKFLLFFCGLFLITGCFLRDDDEAPLSITLSGSSEVYQPGTKVSATVSFTSPVSSKQIFWKLDKGSYSQGSETQDFGPFPDLDSTRHIVSCSVSTGTHNIVQTIIFKSKFDSKLSPTQKHGRLKVVGTNLCDQAGTPVQLRGVSTHGIQYFEEFYTDTAIQALAQNWKADIIRVSCYVNEGWPDYLSKPSYWHTYIDQIVDWAEKYGIYVLIDWHQLTPGDPNHYINEAKSSETQVI